MNSQQAKHIALTDCLTMNSCSTKLSRIKTFIICNVLIDRIASVLGKKNEWKIKQQFIEAPQTYTLQAFHHLINIAENWWVVEDIHRPIVVRFFRREHKE